MFSGSIVALVTPMKPGGDNDWAALERLIHFHLSSGTQAMVVTGSTGEAFSLTLEEKKQIWKAGVLQVAGRIPVIAGTGLPSTEMTIELSQAAYECGVDACLVLAPAYVKPTQEGLFLHYQSLAQRISMPFWLYNVPSRTVTDLLPETVARLSSIPNVIGIKEATGDLKRLKKIQELTDRFLVLSGDDATSMEWMWQGAHGVISVTANVAPQWMAQMCEAAASGDKTYSHALDQRLSALHQLLFIETNPIPTKWCLAQMGLISDVLRLPLTSLSQAYHAAVRQALQQASIQISTSSIHPIS